INDTTSTHTWTDSYPYAAISAFALNPVYLNLSRVVGTVNRGLLEELEPERQRLNSLEEVDYEAVLKAKLSFLGRIYPSEKGAVFRSKAYREFLAQNRHWLVPYAVFCHLRDQYGTADFQRWPAFREYHAEEIAAFAASGAKAPAIEFHYFLQ